MKISLELPDDLLLEAKAADHRRRTTLKSVIEHVLRREIGLDQPETAAPDRHFKIGALGLPVLKGTGQKMNIEDFQKVVERIEQEDDEKYLQHLRS